MKAYHILMFLLIFNMFFWIVSVGIGIYGSTYSGNEGFSLSDASQDPEYGIFSIFSITGHVGLDIMGFAGLLAVAAVVGWVIAQQAPQGLVYAAFGWFFWSSFKNSMTIFYSISNSAPGVLYVIIIFGMIAGGIFIVGLYQMATQGWASFE